VATCTSTNASSSSGEWPLGATKAFRMITLWMTRVTEVTQSGQTDCGLGSRSRSTDGRQAVRSERFVGRRGWYKVDLKMNGRASPRRAGGDDQAEKQPTEVRKADDGVAPAPKPKALRSPGA